MLALAPQILFGLGEEGGEPHLSHKLSASGCLGLPRVSPTTYKGAAKRRGRGVPRATIAPCTLSPASHVYSLQMSALSLAEAEPALARARSGDHDAFAELIGRH